MLTRDPGTCMFVCRSVAVYGVLCVCQVWQSEWQRRQDSMDTPGQQHTATYINQADYVYCIHVSGVLQCW